MQTPRCALRNLRNLSVFWRGSLRIALIGLAGLYGPLSALAGEVQDTSQASRPKIGLVLGGGGARGSAHVGVLKVLEAQHIPIDYIAGNSMGAIVGGLYAEGMTPDQIQHELETIDWDDVFTDAPPRPDRSFRRKRDDDIYAVKSRLGYSDGQVKFPLALVEGQKFDLELSRLTLPAAKIHDFNKLPIPFRAVATDIETGRAVVLQTGDLAQAIRASMAVPGAFAPVEIDGKLLVDGLVSDNVPVDVVRAMGADIVIVVDVGSGLFKRDEIKGVLDVVAQLTNILSQRNVEQQLATLKPSDILIRPALGKMSAGDFNKADEGIEKGEQAARAALPALSHLSVDAATYRQYMARREGRPKQPVIDFVRLDNQSHIGDETILSHITLKPGQPLNTAKLEAEISEIYGLDVFETVRYEVVEENGKSGVVLHAKEKAWGPNYLQFGVELSSNFAGESAYNLGVLYTRTAINDRNGEVRLGLQFGQDAALGAEWYQPIDPASLYFFNAGTFLRRDQYNIYSEDNLTSQYSIYSTGVDLAVGRTLGEWGEGRIGYRMAFGKADVTVGDPTLTDFDFRLGTVYGRLYLDKLDSVSFPTRGNKGKVELIAARKSLGSDTTYNQALLSYSQAFSWGRNNLVGAFNLNATQNDNAPLESEFCMGGFLRLSGYQPCQLVGQNSGLLDAVYYRRVFDQKILPVYIGGSIEYGNVWQTRDEIAFNNGLFNGSLFLGADTPIGPVYVGAGFGEGGRYSGFLYLGSPF
jgi:NTE family protein